MKNQKFILIISLVFFSFIEGNYLQAACIVPTIAQTSTAPTIDGNIDAAWTTAPAQSIAKIVLGTPANNPAGQWRAMFDGTNFYFLIEVNDPDRRINGSWDGDAVELYIRNSAPAKQQIGFAYQTNTTPTRYGDYTGGTSFMRDVATTYNGTSGGYILEVSIPKTAMGFGAYTAGNSIFMEIAINETNNSGGTNRASQLVWNNTASDHHNSYANYTSAPTSLTNYTIRNVKDLFCAAAD